MYLDIPEIQNHPLEKVVDNVPKHSQKQHLLINSNNNIVYKQLRQAKTEFMIMAVFQKTPFVVQSFGDKNNSLVVPIAKY